MKLKYILTSIAMCLILTVGCNPQEEFLDHSEITVSKSVVGIPLDGGSSEITLETSADWLIVSIVETEDEEGDPSGIFENAPIPTWLTISKTTGSANPSGETISFSAEATGSDREVTLNIIAAEKVQYIIVNQASDAGDIKISTTQEAKNGIVGKIYFVEGVITAIAASEYGNLTIEDATGTIETWGTLDAEGKEKNYLSLGLAVGDKILISGPLSSYQKLEAVTVLEIKKSLLSSDDEVELKEAKADSALVNVKCKAGGVKFSIAENDWLTFDGVQSKDGENYVFTFAAKENTALTERTVNVTFSVSGDDDIPAVTTTIVQPGTAVFEDDFDRKLGKWTQVKVKGSKLWESAEYNKNSYAQLSAYKSTEDIETWMVTPKLEITKEAVFYFDSQFDNLAGKVLSVFISDKEFDGKTINVANWTDITNNFTYPSLENVFKESDKFDLSAYIGKDFYIAFKYAGGPKITTTQRIDNVFVVEL